MRLAEPLRDRQTISSLVEPEEPDISGLIHVISNRLGASRLHRRAQVFTGTKPVETAGSGEPTGAVHLEC